MYFMYLRKYAVLPLKTVLLIVMIPQFMKTNLKVILFALILTPLLSTASVKKKPYRHYPAKDIKKIKEKIITGADQTKLYIDYLKGKNIGMVINQTSVIGKNLTLSLDTLLKLGITVKKIYGPEHGFRGNASNGASITYCSVER